MNQTTLRDVVRFSGVGVHSGADASVEVRPAPPGFGLQFLLGDVYVPAIAEHVVETERATVLGIGKHRVSTVEHLLSALLGMGVVNAELVVTGPEIPIVDGSAKTFAEAIASVGVDVQRSARAVLELREVFELRDGDRAIILLPSDALRIRFLADFPAPIGTQYFDGRIDPAFYRAQIAPARTFAYLREVDALRARGLALGGSLENALVFAPEGAMQEMRWPNEVVRHKVLDLLGDLALLAAWPQCEVIAVKSGHDLHARAMRELRAGFRADVAAQRAEAGAGSR